MSKERTRMIHVYFFSIFCSKKRESRTQPTCWAGQHRAPWPGQRWSEGWRCGIADLQVIHTHWYLDSCPSPTQSYCKIRCFCPQVLPLSIQISRLLAKFRLDKSRVFSCTSNAWCHTGKVLSEIALTWTVRRNLGTKLIELNALGLFAEQQPQQPLLHRRTQWQAKHLKKVRSVPENSIWKQQGSWSTRRIHTVIRELLYVSFTTLSLVCLRHGCIGATKTWRCGRCGCSHKSIRGSIQQGQTTWQSGNLCRCFWPTCCRHLCVCFYKQTISIILHALQVLGRVLRPTGNQRSGQSDRQQHRQGQGLMIFAPWQDHWGER